MTDKTVSKTTTPFVDNNASVPLGAKIDGVFTKKLATAMVVSFTYEGKRCTGILHVSNFPSNDRNERDKMFAVATEKMPAPGLTVIAVEPPTGDKRLTALRLTARTTSPDKKMEKRKPAKNNGPKREKFVDRNADLTVGTKVENGVFGKKFTDAIVVTFVADGKPRSGILHVSNFPSEKQSERDSMFAAATEGQPAPAGLVVIEVTPPKEGKKFTSVRITGRPNRPEKRNDGGGNRNGGGKPNGDNRKGGGDRRGGEKKTTVTPTAAEVSTPAKVDDGARVVVAPDLHVPPVENVQAILAEQGVDVAAPRKGKGGDGLVTAIADAMVAVTADSKFDKPGRSDNRASAAPAVTVKRPNDPLARARELVLEVRQPVKSFGLADLKRVMAVRKVGSDAQLAALLESIEGDIAQVDAFAAEATRICSGADQDILEKASVLSAVRAEKKVLEARNAAVKSQSARYAGLCGKIKRAGDNVPEELTTEATELKSAIDTERAALKAAFEANKNADNDGDLALLFGAKDGDQYKEYLAIADNLRETNAKRDQLINELVDKVVAYETRLANLG